MQGRAERVAAEVLARRVPGGGGAHRRDGDVHGADDDRDAAGATRPSPTSDCALKRLCYGGAPIAPTVAERGDRRARPGLRADLRAGRGADGDHLPAPWEHTPGRLTSAGRPYTFVAVRGARRRGPGRRRRARPARSSRRGPQRCDRATGNRPEATAETIEPDGWLHTGDIGRWDDEGYLHLLDRRERHDHQRRVQRLPSRGRGRAAQPTRRWSRRRSSGCPTSSGASASPPRSSPARAVDAGRRSATYCAGRLAGFKRPARSRSGRTCPRARSASRCAARSGPDGRGSSRRTAPTEPHLTREDLDARPLPAHPAHADAAQLASGRAGRRDHRAARRRGRGRPGEGGGRRSGARRAGQVHDRPGGRALLDARTRRRSPTCARRRRSREPIEAFETGSTSRSWR